MAWGARQENGAWRLCERRGRTITHVSNTITPPVEIRFPGRARAEECAHEMNERFWDTYDRKKKFSPAAWDILALIHKHSGISDDDWKRIHNG